MTRIVEHGKIEKIFLDKGVITAKIHEGFLKDRDIRISFSMDPEFAQKLGGLIDVPLATNIQDVKKLGKKKVSDHKITITMW